MIFRFPSSPFNEQHPGNTLGADGDCVVPVLPMEWESSVVREVLVGAEAGQEF